MRVCISRGIRIDVQAHLAATAARGSAHGSDSAGTPHPSATGVAPKPVSIGKETTLRLTLSNRTVHLSNTVLLST